MASKNSIPTGPLGITTCIISQEQIDPGDEVVWLDTDDGIVVKKRTRTAGRGMLVPDDVSEEKRAEVAEKLAQRVRDRRDHQF